jgi:hypothetical protein
VGGVSTANSADIQPVSLYVIGVACTAAEPWEGGPNPRLTHNLPGWLLRDPSCPDPQWGGWSAPR